MIKKIISILNKLLLVKKIYSGNAIIFMLHRVDDWEQGKLFSNENMKVTPSRLEEIIVELKKSNYNFISLNQLHENLKNSSSSKKNIVITLDDGYLDNYTKAFPIFKKYNVPFTIYVTTAFVEKTALFWWYALEDLILKNTIIDLAGQTIKTESISEKEEAFLTLRKIILNLEGDDVEEQLKKMFSSYSVDWVSYCEKLALNWEQIQELNSSDLCTIGNHTHSHLNMKNLSIAKFNKEIEVSESLLTNYLGKKSEHFAFPYGSKNEVLEREFELIKDYDFKTVTSTRRGEIYQAHSSSMNILPRIMLNNSFSMDEIGSIRRKKITTY